MSDRSETARGHGTKWKEERKLPVAGTGCGCLVQAGAETEGARRGGPYPLSCHHVVTDTVAVCVRSDIGRGEGAFQGEQPGTASM